MAGLIADKMGYNKVFSLSATTKRKKESLNEEETAGLYVCQNLESCCLNPD